MFHRIDAMVTAHMAKEETIVFPLLESRGQVGNATETHEIRESSDASP